MAGPGILRLADGTDLAADLAGEPGAPPLVLLHAGIADRRMWRDALPLLAAHRRVLAYDLRGYGGSSGGAGPYAPADDLLEVAAVLGDGPVAACGVSFGAAVVLDAALAAPERFSALVLAGPMVLDAPPDGFEDDVERADRLGEAGDVEEAAEVEVRVWLDGVGRDRPVAAELRAAALAMATDTWRRAREDDGSPHWLADPSDPAALAALRTPTLVVAGGHDRPACVESSRRLADLLPAARLVVLPHVAHLAPMEDPRAFADALLAFAAHGDGG